MPRTLSCLGLICAALLAAMPAAFADDAQFQLTVKNHQFQPTELTLPAGKQIKLTVKNEDAAPMEFESYELDREKVIVGNSSAVVYLGPLDPGTYKFFDDFHQATTGVIKVVPPKQ